jgi:NitT/TauT family transport system ATP-binding protein
MPLIRLSEVTKGYDRPVLAPLTFEILEREFVILLGPSGCGKSTLLRLLSGIENIDSGELCFSDRLNRSVVFQEPRLLPWRTVIENVMVPFELQSLGDRQSVDRALEALRTVGLFDFASHYPRELSGGMQMRVAIARALVTNPKLLLLDEPFAALDEVSRFRLQEELLRLCRQTELTVVFVTHSLSEAVYLGSRHIVLSQRPARIIGDRAAALPPGDRVRTAPAFQKEIEALQEILKDGAQ